MIETIQKNGNIVSKIKTAKALEKLNEKDTAQISKFDLYSDNALKISYLKPYQILALNRGESIGILNIKIEKSEETAQTIRLKYANI